LSFFVDLARKENNYLDMKVILLMQSRLDNQNTALNTKDPTHHDEKSSRISATTHITTKRQANTDLADAWNDVRQAILLSVATHLDGGPKDL